jgi:Fis family transcriptional regulator
MKMEAAATQIDGPREKLNLPQADHTEPLSQCVRKALRYYLQHLGGYEVNDLHQMVIREVERPLVETALEYTQGNQTQAARLLGLSRSTLRKKMSQHEIGNGG